MEDAKNQSLADDDTFAAVMVAFNLGWDLTELSNRLEISRAQTQVIVSRFINPDQADSDQLDDEFEQAFGPVAQMSTLWRAIFDRIARTYADHFPQSSTAHTFYEPIKGWPAQFPFLYGKPDPDGKPDPPYVVIGLQPLPGDPLSAFTLYDVTRRLLNCLNVLYAHQRSGVFESFITDYQTKLIQAQLNSVLPITVKQRAEVIDNLSATISMLLNGWSDLLLEQYSQGINQTDAKQSISDSTAELIAFRTGSSLSQISWGVSASNVPKENQESPDVKFLYTTFDNAFDWHVLTTCQHDIAALSAVLDSAYSRIHDQPQPSGDDTSAKNDLDLPSNGCLAVIDSLTFWRRAIDWLKPVDSTPINFTPTIAANLREALIVQSNVWRDLLTCQLRLEVFTVESVMHHLIEEVMNEFQDTLRQDVQLTLGKTMRGLAPFIGIVAVVLLFALASLFLLKLVDPRFTGLNPNGFWAILGLAPLTAWLANVQIARSSGTTPANSTAAAPQPSVDTTNTANAPQLYAVLTRFGAYLSPLLPVLAEIMQRALNQIKIELATLNHAVGVAYPLVDCFILAKSDHDGPPKPGAKARAIPQTTEIVIDKIQSDYSFMQHVIWTDTERQDELKRVIRVALGPLSLLFDLDAVAKKRNPRQLHQLSWNFLHRGAEHAQTIRN